MKEKRSFEVKERVTNTFLKTVSAYANFSDGIIRFGITDDGKFVGIEDAGNACLDIENRINDSISPVPDYRISVDDDTNVITLEVKEGIYKPYYYKSKAYKRNDTATIEVDRLELNRLILEGEDRSYDELVSDVKDLEFTILEGKMKEQLGISVSVQIYSGLSEYLVQTGNTITQGFYLLIKMEHMVSTVHVLGKR